MEMENKILVANGEKKVLKELFETSYYTVRQALKGKTSTVLGHKIRQTAIKRGGMEIEPKKTE